MITRVQVKTNQTWEHGYFFLNKYKGINILGQDQQSLFPLVKFPILTLLLAFAQMPASPGSLLPSFLYDIFFFSFHLTPNMFLSEYFFYQASPSYLYSGCLYTFCLLFSVCQLFQEGMHTLTDSYIN